MKVLHVYKTYLPDNFQGIPRVIWEIAEGTHRLGVTHEVLSVSATPEPQVVPVANHLSHRARQDLFIASTGLSLSVFRRYRELAAGADLIHYHFPWPLMDLLHLSAPRRLPSIVTYHSDIVRQKTLRRLYAPLMHRFLDSVDRLVATSPDYVRSSPVLQRHIDRVAVIPIGLEDRSSPPADRIAHWRARLGEGFFLFVGALRYYKGLQFLAAAARETGLKVVIIGTGEFGAELADNPPPSLIMLGELDDADRDAVMSLCRAFVFPSHLRSEAFGVAMLEAARAGKPMICCELGTGTTYVNVDGETGLVIRPADAAALGRAMLTFAADAALAQTMGRQARRRYEALFTAPAMAQAYVDLYEAVLRQG